MNDLTSPIDTARQHAGEREVRTTWTLVALTGLAVTMYHAWNALVRPDRVKVEFRTGYTTSKSLEPIRIEIYDYLSRKERQYRYQVSKKPPLVFAFPAAYYVDGLGLGGGPVYAAQLEIDMRNWSPAVLGDLSLVALTPGTREQRRLFRLYHLMVTLNSNVSGRDGGQLNQEFKEQWRERFPEARLISENWMGFKLIGMLTANDRLEKDLPPIMVDGINMSAMGYLAWVPVATPGAIEQIYCSGKGNACVASFCYFNRRIGFHFSREAISHVHEIVPPLRKLLNRYRVANEIDPATEYCITPPSEELL